MFNSNITLPVSLGEALDKYSILELKKQRIKDPTRLIDVMLETVAIHATIAPVLDKYPYHYRCLYNINSDIWDLSDAVRKAELEASQRDKLFSEIFLKNDARFRVKLKLNLLATSTLREQKSYPTSTVVLEPASSLDVYKEKNGYIRYLALCYDCVVVQCPEDLVTQVKLMFSDDPFIKVQVGNNLGQSLTEIVEPIPNLLTKFDFGHTVEDEVLNYICGGRLGDFLHALYVVRGKYLQTGRKGHVYITDDPKWGGDRFGLDIRRTYTELYDIVMLQPYIANFSLYNGQPVKFDINLNAFRQYPLLWQESWLEIMSNTFNIPLLEEPWITLPDSWYDPKYKDTIVVHRSPNSERCFPQFIDHLSNIAKHSRCVFVTCNISEYESFPLKSLMPVELKSTLREVFIAINSCKFFIGNQSSPLVMAFSLFKPALCESAAGKFYTNRVYYPGFNWVSHNQTNLETLSQYLESKPSMKHVVFVNHAVQNCGVYQYGKRLAKILTKSKNIQFSYHEISSAEEYGKLCEDGSIDAFIYNYHSSTLPWLNDATIQRRVPNIGLHHEGRLASFDHVLTIDATNEPNSLPRPLIEYDKPITSSTIPIIGSFGFGFENKGFTKLVEYVNAQFDEAIIRLNITFPYFGDNAGDISKRIAEQCNAIPRKPGIQLVITHDFMNEAELLDWLNANTLNIFMYDKMLGRGCASTIDYALSVNRPIAISDSHMFRHIYCDEICVFKTPIKTIIEHGLEHVAKFKTEWSPEKTRIKMDRWLIQNVFRHVIIPIKIS